MNTREKLTNVFRETFGDESIVISDETTANDIEGWDSLSHVNLIIAIELAFDIEFTTSEIISFENVGQMIACIEEKIKKT